MIPLGVNSGGGLITDDNAINRPINLWTAGGTDMIHSGTTVDAHKTVSTLVLAGFTVFAQT